METTTTGATTMEDTFTIRSASRAGAIAFLRREASPQRVQIIAVEDMGRSGNSRMWAVTFRMVR